MNRLMSLSLAAVITASLSQGCATSPQTAQAVPTATVTSAAPTSPAGADATGSCMGPACGLEVMRAAHKTEVPVEKEAPAVQGHPLTSVVVTQCNLIVAVYLTMQDGKLMRFDSRANVPADQLLQMAYSATRSERVEVDCNGNAGAVGYEKHEPV